VHELIVHSPEVLCASLEAVEAVATALAGLLPGLRLGHVLRANPGILRYKGGNVLLNYFL
jgi:hypothetical protein